MQYSYFKRYNRFSIGGTMRPISRPVLKSLITRFDGKIKREYRLPGDCRVIELSNNNQILVHL